MLSVLLAVLAAASNAVASVLQRKANRDEAAGGGSGLQALAHVLRRPLWLGGLGAVLLSFGLQAGALATGELALVQPLLSLELPLTLLLGARVFRRPLAGRDWVAVSAMSAGLALLLLALQPQGGDPTQPDGVEWLLGAGAAGLFVLLLVGLAVGSRGTRRAALLGMASGVSFALTAVFMAAGLATGLSDAFLRWQTYLLAVSGLVAMLLLQEALQAGSLVAVQPGVTLVDPVVAVLLGVLLFHEQVHTGGWLVGAAAGAAAIGWGTFRLSHSPAMRSGEQPANDAAQGGKPTGPPRRNVPAAQLAREG